MASYVFGDSTSLNTKLLLVLLIVVLIFYNNNSNSNNNNNNPFVLTREHKCRYSIEAISSGLIMLHMGNHALR